METAVLALLFSPCSSMILKCKLGDFLGACNLSNVMGSTKTLTFMNCHRLS